MSEIILGAIIMLIGILMGAAITAVSKEKRDK